MSAKEKPPILNTRLHDNSSKLIFDEPILCAQFLRDYVEGIPCLQDIRPEDIEDVSERYVPLFAEERNSDSVKKIHIKNGTPFFLISLIEHKTKVEYNVTMQIFRYMVYIWDDYEREAEKQRKGVSRQKGFRYPPILPIVYYEGKDEWTVPPDFKSRIIEGDAFARYIPDFHYYLVPLRKYSNGELLDRKDEISLVMLINKLQGLDDLTSFRTLPSERLDEILQGTPDHIVGTIADILKAFLLKANVPADDAEDIAGKVKEKKMGTLFANMDPIDIPAEQAKIRAQKQELAAEQQKLTTERQELAAKQQKLATERQELAAKQQKLATERQELDSKWQELDAWKQEIYALKQEIYALKQEVDARKQEVDARKQEIDARKQETDAREQALAAGLLELESQKQELKIMLQKIEAERGHSPQ